MAQPKDRRGFVELSKSPCFGLLLSLISSIAVADIPEERRIDVRGGIEFYELLKLGTFGGAALFQKENPEGNMGKENSKLRFGISKCFSFLAQHRRDCLPHARHQRFFSFIKSGMRLLQATATAIVGVGLLAGCAIHYYDKESGTEHLWGFGHLKMKAPPPNEGVQAVVTGTETLGFNVGAGEEDYHIGAGWDYRRRIVISSNAAVRLEWPNRNFFNVRFGTVPPFATNSLATQNKPNP